MLKPREKFNRLLKKHKEYDSEAYSYIYEVLDYTEKNIAKKSKSEQVSARELTEGFKSYTINKFGCLARTVLNEWGVKTTNDIGNIVFYLIEFDLMAKQKSDKIEDFYEVYNFNHAFNIKPKILYDYEAKEWLVSYSEKINSNN